MRYLFGSACLVIGMAFLWTWVAGGPRWMLGVAITALILYAVTMAPGRPKDSDG